MLGSRQSGPALAGILLPRRSQPGWARSSWAGCWAGVVTGPVDGLVVIREDKAASRSSPWAAGRVLGEGGQGTTACLCTLSPDDLDEGGSSSKTTPNVFGFAGIPPAFSQAEFHAI